MTDNVQRFIDLMKHPVKFRMFLFSKLPSAYFAGVRLHAMTPERCEVSVPYKWFSQNPFRSTYFACLSMAAEMSTGALSMAYLYKIQPKVSMLVTRVEGDFIKKATGLTIFTCEDGELLKQAIFGTIGSGEARTARAKSIGRNKAGEVVAEFHVTWSFKVKQS
jgi:hypothetical protein